MSENVLMKKLMALDFMAIDIALFLDTHPHDKKALEAYCEVVSEGKRARRDYEEQYGPICHDAAAQGGKWSWICEPWPWECEANFHMRGDE